jgi:hypothetical protein
MKKLLSIVTLSCFAVLAFASVSGAVSLTGIYDFEGQVEPDTVFEGLAFTADADGNPTLWITSAPDTPGDFGSLFKPDTLLEVNLDFDAKTGNVVNVSSYNQPTSLFSPVGLASDGTELFVANNAGGSIYETTTTGMANYLYDAGCTEPEGASYLGDHLYVSCEELQRVLKIDPSTGAVVDAIAFDQNLLGLGATETALIVGKYGSDPLDRSLELYDINTGERDVINLADFFVGPDSDYFHLTGEIYDEFERGIPDPDGLAYWGGKIYMTFEHDPRVFELSLDDTPPVPEPGTLLLIGSGLLALAGLRRKRS